MASFIAPGIESINFTDNLATTHERTATVKVVGIDERIPLSSLGNGMLRVLGIALALVNAEDGILLIDEFENSLYYSVQSDLWRLIFQIAHRLNIQVFATTHSWDCIKAFQSATQGDTQDTGMLIRLESRKHGIGATLFDQSELGIVTREQIEVR
jgi:AAA15 family ATPase/GTPase